MLATIMLDTFKKDEAPEVASALDELCSPHDNYAFSSACIYAFWTVPQQELLYIGLTKDIARRFRQHTGLVQCAENCCKRKQIETYFDSNDRLGLSVMVQSNLCQPKTKKDEDVIASAISDDPFIAEIKDVFDAEQNVALAEGMLLELHNQLGDRLPEWNKIHGSKHGRKRQSLYEFSAQIRTLQGLVAGKSFEHVLKELEEDGMPFELLLNMEGSELSELNARSTLREIADNATVCEHELLLHGVRITIASQLRSFEYAVAVQERDNPYAGPRFERMQGDGYWNKKVTLPGISKRKP